MKYGKLLVVLVALAAIFLFSCSSSKTTNPEDKFWEELENAEYLVGIGVDPYYADDAGFAFITYYSGIENYPQVTLRINNELVEIEWDYWIDAWDGYIDQIFTFSWGDDVKVQLSTPTHTSNQTIKLPYKPEITNTDFPPKAQTDFTLRWDIRQNADLQIVTSAGWNNEVIREYSEVINRSHRSHVIPGSTFPANLIGWNVELTNVAWKSSENHGIMSIEWVIKPDLLWPDSRQQDIQSRYREVYQLLKNQWGAK